MARSRDKIGAKMFLKGMDLLRRFLTAESEEQAEVVLEELREFRRQVFEAAAAGSLNGGKTHA